MIIKNAIKIEKNQEANFSDNHKNLIEDNIGNKLDSDKEKECDFKGEQK